ncbi:helix-turn-helix domain-containing protein [Paenibacillus sp. SI8]|uniref:helix-turn-helix domain-containing protein n=1 Tax=unclassified Paenibacillus TaxID=185978 RepID=UPI003466DFF9
MARSSNFNPNRLRTARQYAGLTISELAEQACVSKQAISQFETGRSTPSLETLMRMMAVLKFPRDFFYENERSEEIQIGNTFFRSLASTSKKERISQVQKTELLSEIVSFFEQYIDFPLLNLPNLKEIIELTDEKLENASLLSSDDIEDITLALRRVWNIGEEPITNMVYLLELNGIIVSSLSTETHNIDAFSQRQILGGRERYLVVLGDGKQSASRRQFDAAHELAHILLHNWNVDSNEILAEEHRLIEQQADKFAGAFLLPKNAFTQDLHYPTNLDFYVELKKKWRVSIAAMVVRAYHLEVISYNQYHYLMRQMNSRKMRVKEPLDDFLPIPQPVLLSQAVEMLLANNVLKPQQILQGNGLSLTKDVVEYLLNLESGTLNEKEEKAEVILQLVGKKATTWKA